MRLNMDINRIYRTFGYKAQKPIKKVIRRKLDPKISEYILIGYGLNQYRLLNPQTDQITWARDVKIIEIRPLNLNKSLKGLHNP
jgi:hypothetical protein